MVALDVFVPVSNCMWCLPQLAVLNLQRNPGIKADGAAAIGDALGSGAAPSLERLYFWDSPVGDVGFKAICQGLTTAARQGASKLEDLILVNGGFMYQHRPRRIYCCYLRDMRSPGCSVKSAGLFALSDTCTI